MNFYVYNVKIKGIRQFNNVGMQHDEELANQTFSGINAVERFVSWWFNGLDMFEMFGFNADTLFEYFIDVSHTIYAQTWCGNNDTGFEAFPAEKIRRACPVLKDFYGFQIEITQIEVFPSNWKGTGKHWKE